MSDPSLASELIAPVMIQIRALHEAWKVRRLRVFAEECGTCALDSVAQRTCQFVLDDGCKYRGELASRNTQRGREARCKSAKVPGKYWGEVGSIEHCSALVSVRAVLDGRSLGAVLLGTPGSGKSLCASFALAERGGIFASASQLDVLSAEVAGLIERLCETPMAVLDDVGRGRSATVLALDRTEDVLCRRYDAGLPTIVTANLTRADFWALHAIGGGRVIDRLGEDAITLCREPSKRNRPTSFNEMAEK